MSMIRRTLLMSLGAASLLVGTAMAQTNEIKVGVIAPFSGPWARQGELMLKGAELAIDHINASGGIKSMGGAKLKLLTFDTSDSAEKAKNAAQRMVSQEPDLVAATGAWLSSFTLAVTEVTERAELPMTTLSYADQINTRGFKYIFQTSLHADAQAKAVLPAVLAVGERVGAKVKTAAILVDNTAAASGFAKPMREGALEKAGIKLVVDETFTPPLADATPLIQKVRSTKPDLLFLLPTAVSDDKLMIEKLSEFGMGQGKLPIVANGAHFGTPEVLKSVGPELMEGVMVSVGNWVVKGQEDILAQFKKKTGEPWMTQDSLSSYGDMWIFKEALEIAKKADRKAVADAIRSMDTTEGPAKFFPGGRIKWDEAGRRVGANVVIVQWQKGVPVPVYPPETATHAPIWPKN